jgi:hypothetical protein
MDKPHQNICPIFNTITRNDPILTYVIRDLNFATVIRVQLKESNSHAYITDFAKTHNKTIHDFIVTINNDPITTVTKCNKYFITVTDTCIKS